MPLRSCLNCRKKTEKSALVRLVPVDGFLRVDIRGLVQARGAYICADPACVKEAYRKKGSFSRALKQQVKLPDEAEFILEISSIKRV